MKLKPLHPSRLLQGRHARQVLGLAPEGDRLAAVELALRDGEAELLRSALLELPAELLKAEAPQAGRQLREQLDRAGMTARSCVFCAPMKWILTLRVELPELPEADVANYLRLRAEREFPHPPAELALAIARGRSGEGKQFAVLAAIPLRLIANLREVLAAAGLRLVSVTTRVAALRKAGAEQNAVALLLTRDAVELGVFAGQEPLALRSLETGAAAADAPDCELLARELRITLGQLPGFDRTQLKPAFVFDCGAANGNPLAGSEERFARLGLKVEPGGGVLNSYLSKEQLAQCVSPVTAFTAAKYLREGPDEFEFLPPAVNRVKQVIAKISSRGALWLGGAGAALILFVLLAFLIQGLRLGRLERNWAAIETDVRQAEALQGQIREFRPWFDDSARTLTLLRGLTEAFPEDGAVWLRKLELRDGNRVSGSGSARTNRDWLAMLDALRANPNVTQLQTGQVRGADPLQFTFSFIWQKGNGDGL